jgi:hypothetical protein
LATIRAAVSAAESEASTGASGAGHAGGASSSGGPAAAALQRTVDTLSALAFCDDLAYVRALLDGGLLAAVAPLLLPRRPPQRPPSSSSSSSAGTGAAQEGYHLPARQRETLLRAVNTLPLRREHLLLAEGAAGAAGAPSAPSALALTEEVVAALSEEQRGQLDRLRSEALRARAAALGGPGEEGGKNAHG